MYESMNIKSFDMDTMTATQPSFNPGGTTTQPSFIPSVPLEPAEKPKKIAYIGGWGASSETIDKIVRVCRFLGWEPVCGDQRCNDLSREDYAEEMRKRYLMIMHSDIFISSKYWGKDSSVAEMAERACAAGLGLPIYDRSALEDIVMKKVENDESIPVYFVGVEIEKSGGSK